MREFRCDCVLNKELYIVRAPIKIKHLEILENQGIKSILSLSGIDIPKLCAILRSTL